MGERNMLYEHVVEALARHLHNHDNWETLNPKDQRDSRRRAETLLAGWDYMNENGRLVNRYLATPEEGVNREARGVFFANIVKETLKASEKHLHKLRMKKHSFDDAVEAVAEYAYRAEGGHDWDGANDTTKTGFKDVAKQALLSRGFHQFDGVLHYADNQCFGHLTGLLQGAFAEQNVRELLRHADETRVDKLTAPLLKSDQIMSGPAPLVRPADMPVVDLRGTREDAARYNQNVKVDLRGTREDAARYNQNVKVDTTRPVLLSAAAKFGEVTGIDDDNSFTIRLVMLEAARRYSECAGVEGLEFNDVCFIDALSKLSDTRMPFVDPKVVEYFVSSRLDVQKLPNGNWSITPQQGYELTPFSTHTERLRAESAAASPYPVNEEGAEEYTAVQATVASVPEAVDVYARDLYERQTAGMPMVKPFMELNEELKKTYRTTAGELSYDREKANKLYFKQRAADAKDDIVTRTARGLYEKDRPGSVTWDHLDGDLAEGYRARAREKLRADESQPPLDAIARLAGRLYRNDHPGMSKDFNWDKVPVEVIKDYLKKSEDALCEMDDSAVWDLARREYEKQPYRAVGGGAVRDITWDELLHGVKEQLYQKAKKNLGTQPFTQAKDALHDTYVLMAKRLYAGERDNQGRSWEELAPHVQSHYIGRAKRSKLDWDEVWTAAGGNKLNEDLKAATTKLKLVTEELAGTGPAQHANMPTKIAPYETLARMTHKMLWQAGITVPWDPAIVDVARATWEGRPVTNNLHNNYIAGAVDSFRKIAGHNGLTLEQFVSGRIAKDLLNSDDTPTARVIIVNEEEATAIAWYAYESQRDPKRQHAAGTPWRKLDAVFRANLIDVCSAYFTTRSKLSFRVEPSVVDTTELYAYIDHLRNTTPQALQERVAGLVKVFHQYGPLSTDSVTLSFRF